MATETQKEPVIATGRDFLKFDKVGGHIPVVVARRLTEGVNKDEIYLSSVGKELLDVSFIQPPMFDCDGDAIWACNDFQGRAEPAINNIVEADDISQLQWGYGGLEAGGQPLLTTVLVDPLGLPLGVAYSSRQSAIENFRPKTLRVPVVEEPQNIVTLRSRSRGIWPKGLKNPNQDKDAPLPETLEMSSGNYLLFRGMRTNSRGDALLIEADVPEGHGFCHESYRRDERLNGVSIYFGDNELLAGTTPYRSCFHRVLLL